jgi:type I restriction enzyme S subunit
LGEVILKKSSNISANSLEDNEGEYIIYGATGVLKKVDFYSEEQPYISIVKDGAGVGRLFLCEKESSVLGTLDLLFPKDNNVLSFLYYLLETIDFNKYKTGSTIPHIYFKDYSLENVVIPSVKEQQKIADFLNAIDNKINAVAQQIEKTEQWKKGLLQKMFV